MTPHENADRVLELRLMSYALAAGVTLACQLPAHGEVIFTQSSSAFRGLGKFDIDLDNDGSVDFSLLTELVRYSTHERLPALFAYGNRPSHQIAAKSVVALALKRGDQIGPGQEFRAFTLMETPVYGGYWQYAKSRCLGVRFLISGQVHYGWIGFREVRDFPVAVKLYGWAYETVPDKGILAGDTGSLAATDTAISPTSLGILATGHMGIEERRKRIAHGQ